MAESEAKVSRFSIEMFRFVELPCPNWPQRHAEYGVASRTTPSGQSRGSTKQSPDWSLARERRKTTKTSPDGRWEAARLNGQAPRQAAHPLPSHARPLHPTAILGVPQRKRPKTETPVHTVGQSSTSRAHLCNDIRPTPVSRDSAASRLGRTPAFRSLHSRGTMFGLAHPWRRRSSNATRVASSARIGQSPPSRLVSPP